MAHEIRMIVGGRKTGGQYPPQLLTNTRAVERVQDKFKAQKEIMKKHGAKMRIENDLYERQNS